jgi:hypothetical protein
MRLVWTGLLGAIVTGIAVAVAVSRPGFVEFESEAGFVAHPLPARTSQDLMDIGLVDANGDGLMDVFTTNHNYRQNLWIAGPNDGYRDMVSDWGFDQSPRFPGLEVSLSDPQFDAPGVYIYWKDRRVLVIRAYDTQSVGPIEGTVRTYTTVKSYESDGFTVDVSKPAQEGAQKASETVVSFSAARGGILRLTLASPGVPVTMHLADRIPLQQAYVGALKVSPEEREFELAFQDPHGMAWSEYDGDGGLDVFVTRGAIGGTARTLPDSVSRKIADRLLVSHSGGKYRNVASEVGIRKNGCSGRKVTWVDFDADGLLDLYINCQDRGVVEGEYSKQLYRQTREKRFEDVAERVGLALAGKEVIDFAWFDVDQDGAPDLVTSESTGFFVYWNDHAKFVSQFIGRGRFARADLPKLKGVVEEYWVVDGKMSVADFDGDGDLDIFSSSKKGNELLVNRGARAGFSIKNPSEVGLPDESATAVWVDYDNDGLTDLHAVPNGLFHQGKDHRFQGSKLLALPARKYMAAIINWSDLDNDGSRDVVVAVLENFSLWPWWKRLHKDGEDRFTWDLMSLKGQGNGNHWLQVKLNGSPGNRQGIGARVTVRTAKGLQTQEVGVGDGAFFSQGHYRLYFGLGAEESAEEVQVRWPDGHAYRIDDVKGDRLLVIDR